MGRSFADAAPVASPSNRCAFLPFICHLFPY
jgi:hypothetical protein